jgi:hypothetical protein
MKISQVSIFLENKSGRLSEVTRLLAEQKINIRALTLADTSDFGILRLIVNNPQKALTVLRGNGFTVAQTEVIAAEVKDKPGGLAEIVDILSKAKLNIEYMYAFVEKQKEKAIIVFKIENVDKAIEVLTKNEVRLLPAKDVINL